MEKKKIICFDVDGTLTETKSSWLALTQGLGCPVEKVVYFFNAAMAGKITFAQGKKAVADIYRAGGNATEENIKNIFKQEKIKPEAIGLVDYLKKKNYDIWLVSGAIDIHVAAVAEKIGAKGYFAHSSLEFDRQGALCAINYDGDQNPWKVEMVRKIAESENISPQEIVFAGDGQNDIDSFALTGKGIAVCPYDERLEALAWKKVKSLPEIKNIL